MLNLPSDLYNRCRTIFLTCSQFDSYEQLRSIFVTPELYPFRSGLRRGNSPEELVDFFLEFILEQELPGGDPAFPVFLTALRDKYREGNNRRTQLTLLIGDVQCSITAQVTRPSLTSMALEKDTEDKKQSTKNPASSSDSNPGTASSANPDNATAGDREALDAEEKKDFFISYNKHDKAWAEWIAWQLENAGYSTIIQAWDFRPSGNFVADMQRAMANTERTIAVLSPDYLTSKFTQPEWHAAFASDPTGELGLLLPVMVHECTLTGLLPQIVHIKMTGLSEDEAIEALLEGVKRGRARPETSPDFPAKALNSKPRFPDHMDPGSAS